MTPEVCSKTRDYHNRKVGQPILAAAGFPAGSPELHVHAASGRLSDATCFFVWHLGSIGFSLCLDLFGTPRGLPHNSSRRATRQRFSNTGLPTCIRCSTASARPVPWVSRLPLSPHRTTPRAFEILRHRPVSHVFSKIQKWRVQQVILQLYLLCLQYLSPKTGPNRLTAVYGETTGWFRLSSSR